MGKPFRNLAGFGKHMEYWVTGLVIKEGLDVYMPLADGYKHHRKLVFEVQVGTTHYCRFSVCNQTVTKHLDKNVKTAVFCHSKSGLSLFPFA